MTVKVTREAEPQIELYGAYSGQLDGNGRVSLTFVAADTYLIMVPKNAVSRPQLELGAFATSYIPTAASTVTRNADVASVGVSQFPYSSSASSLVLSLSIFDDGGSDLLKLTHSASVNGLTFSTASGTGAINAYVDASNVNIGVPTLNTVQKVGLAYDGSSNGAVRNGGTVSSVGTTVSAPATKLCIGSSFNGLYPFSGHIRQITYLPRRISNAELQSRTA